VDSSALALERGDISLIQIFSSRREDSSGGVLVSADARDEAAELVVALVYLIGLIGPSLDIGQVGDKFAVYRPGVDQVTALPVSNERPPRGEAMEVEAGEEVNEGIDGAVIAVIGGHLVSPGGLGVAVCAADSSNLLDPRRRSRKKIVKCEKKIKST